MTTPKSIICTYEHEALSFDVPFRSDGFFNATAVAKQFGKETKEWLRLPSTEEYIAQVVDFNQTGDNPTFDINQLVTIKKGAPAHGGGTWLHPKLAVPFARWLDTRFAVWCDMQIDAILRGKAVLINSKSYVEATKIIESVQRLCSKIGVDKPMAIAVSVEHARRATGLDFRELLKTTNTISDPPMNLTELGAVIGVSNQRMGKILTEQGLRAKDPVDGEYRPTERGKKHCTYNPVHSENGDWSGYQPLWYRSVLDELQVPA